MSYADLLRSAAERTGSIVSIGFDPVLERIPLEGTPEHVIATYGIAVLEACEKESCLPGAFKPNIAFYEQYGMQGLRALERIVAKCRSLGIPVILDAKRGDIGKTSEAYAAAAFDVWNADAVTVAPYMGSDSVRPFARDGKGTYVLVRTSNSGAKDFQDLEVDGTPLYLHVAEHVVQWGTGAVVGATYPEELRAVARLFGGSVPLLIPGVGAQGAKAADVVRILREASYDLALCRINSSSGIFYAYEKEGTDDYAGAAVRALKRLNDETGFLRS